MSQEKGVFPLEKLKNTKRGGERESERIYPQISSGQLKKVKQNFVVITHA